MVSVQVTAKHKNVCERVVVATEEIESEERDPGLIAAALKEIPYTKVIKMVEKVEWKCPTLLEAAR